MDLNRVLGALLNGAAQPKRRRRSSTSSILGGRGANAQLARAIGTVAGAAIEAYMRNRQPSPEPPPAAAPRRPGRWSGDVAPQPSASRRVPETGSSPWTTPARAPEPVADAPDAEEAEALLLIRAMIAAAKADGAVDAAERRSIAVQLDSAGLTTEERDFVLADFDRPMTPEALARKASDPMLRARLYAAAFAGAGEVTPAERAWLDTLARALKLDKAAATAIEQRLG